MKTILVVRHAKSSWDNPKLRDEDRPLNSRGVRDAYRMAERHKESLQQVQRAFSSHANRAFHTAVILFKSAGIDLENMQIEPRIYEGYSTRLEDLIRSMNDKFDNIALFGHNPGITEFVGRHQSIQYISNVPTCGMARINFDIDKWSDFTSDLSGELLLYDFPKNVSQTSSST